MRWELPGGLEVLAELGRGGMGCVYLARHGATGVLRAVKMVLLHRPSLAARLRREGRLQRGVCHPNVVPVHRIVELRDQPALVMPYVAGPSLAELLATRHRLWIREVDALMTGILRGAMAAHAQGVVHRDLKPSNVLLEGVGRQIVPRITDFGLATALADDEAPARGTLTQRGAGTERYMSKEQLHGLAPDPRMDVFSLGALMFELLEGAPAFADRDAWHQTVESGEAPQLTRRRVPRRMRRAIRAALSCAADRPADAAALMRLWRPRPVRAPVHPWTFRRATRRLVAAFERILHADAGCTLWPDDSSGAGATAPHGVSLHR